ncbi:MMPL family transporter [Tsukamurella tyrosinosolvens]|uniref:MMPL family transporter n=1 Tax=Tsukamurella tyrosinosolvens TaxID=57704 RepID=UPI002161DDF3|nr:MMPL family transporter [Tsukamurella tyrosinosolvens]
MTKTRTARSTPRWRWLVPALLILGWLVVGSVGGPFAGKLGDVQANDNTSFLPASAEATAVAELEASFVDSSRIPAIVAVERTSGITDADTALVSTAIDRAAGADGIDRAVAPPVRSQDGRALQVVVPIDAGGEVADSVTALRAALATGVPEGLTVYVTGPAGTAADLTEAFGGIDGMLLLVAGAVVIAILVVVYRSPVLPFVVIVSAVLALALASAVIYALAANGAITLNGQSQGILFILVFGAATDYALLLVARYREELGTTADRYAAMRAAWRATLEPVAASAGTVIAGVLCLLLSDLNSNRGLGPVAAIGIAASFLASMTFLPAVLALLGRGAFWPRRPVLHGGSDESPEQAHRFWAGLAERIGRHPRRFWVATTLLLLVGAALAPQFRADGVAQSDTFLVTVDSQRGQEVLSEHFDADDGSPAVIIANAAALAPVRAAATGTQGVAGVAVVPGADGAPRTVDGRVALRATLRDAADSRAAEDTVVRLREAVRGVGGAGALVGGPTAVDLDTRTTALHDRNLIIPVVTLVVLLILCLLLRAILAPILLMATVIVSFAATLGVSSIVFNHILGFPGADPVVPLFAFVFLVALGIDYNIFLMTRAREEALSIGTRAGVLRALTVTGGVITSAGVVLAATFSALAVIPLIFLAQIAFIVAFGVLLDALIVRTLLVPALVHDIGRAVWWPSSLRLGKQ